MSDAASWLSARVNDAPAELRARMIAALSSADKNLPLAEQLALAATECLARTLKAPSARARALDLLTADALMTHACEAAVDEAEGISAFASRWNAARFEQLLTSQADERSR